MIPPTALMGPDGLHDVSATVPPGRTARTISAAAAPGSGAKITPNTLIATSKAPSATGSSSAPPRIQRASMPRSAARAAACSISASAGSTPVTFAPRSAAAIAALPVPQATSRTVCPASMPANSTSASDAGAIASAVRA